MRKFLISAAILSVVAAATPAAAQYYPQRGYDRDYGYQNPGYQHAGEQRIDMQLANLHQRIDRAYQRRLISANEARRLHRQVEQVDRLEDRYSRNGLTRWEMQDLRNRVQYLRQNLRFERQEGRYDRYSDRHDRYSDRYDD
jgi:hypothetical protein